MKFPMRLLIALVSAGAWVWACAAFTHFVLGGAPYDTWYSFPWFLTEYLGVWVMFAAPLLLIRDEQGKRWID